MKTWFHSFVIHVGLGIELPHIMSLRDHICRNYSDWELVFVSSEATVISEQIEAAINLGDIEKSRLMFVAAKRGQTDFEYALPGALSAIGDRVTVMLDVPKNLDEVFAVENEEHTSHDVIFWLPRESRKGPIWKLLSRLFRALSKRTIGQSLEDSDFRMVEFSRKFVGVLERTSRPEALLRNSAGLRGVSTSRKLISFSHMKTKLQFSKQFGRAAEALFNSSTAPLRTVSILALSAAGLNVLYSIYVVLVSFTQDVERGWTSMSLQVSGMFFLTLVVLAALAEFMIFMHRSLSQEPNSIILGEAVSAGVKFERSLNVETGNDQS